MDRDWEQKVIQAFTDSIMRDLPPTWTCSVCGEEHQTDPFANLPYARRTSVSDDGEDVIVVEEICAKCFHQ